MRREPNLVAGTSDQWHATEDSGQAPISNTHNSVDTLGNNATAQRTLLCRCHVIEDLGVNSFRVRLSQNRCDEPPRRS